jgi:hypothetical protein
MSTLHKKVRFFETEEGAQIERELRLMLEDDSYSTESSFSTNSDVYPNNQMPFVDRHMHYISSHPAINPKHYIANLRLMTRIR